MAISKIVTNSVDSGVTITSPTLVTPVLSGSVTGTYTLAGTGTLSSPIISGTPTGVGVLTSDTAQATTSGTFKDFTGIPSWVKRVTVMFNGVSTNGTSGVLVQLGTGGTPTTSGYVGMTVAITTVNNTTRGVIYTTGFGLVTAGAIADSFCGAFIFSLLGSNTWALTGSVYSNTQAAVIMSSGTIALAGVLNIARITTVNGTDTFDAGSINILYE